VKASFGQHLAEARRRLIHVLVVFALAAVLSYPLAKPLLAKVKSDLLGDVELVVLGPQEALMAYLRVSVLMGFALTLPFMMYHLWVFIAPGLLKHERTLILYLVVPSIILFALGVAFGYLVLLPVALRFLLASAVGLATPMLSLGTTFSFITSILLTLGVIFQLPLVTAALTKLGVVDHQMLARYRRHAIVLVFLAAALLTDPSVITQLILAAPMVLLYELGIVTSRLVGGRR
jgi:sec-independent protein translocase protein TatC